jgi:hypothetical protein
VENRFLEIGTFLIAGLGCLLTKYEGVAWLLWMIVVWLSVYLHIRRCLSWREILLDLIAPGVVSCGLFILSTDLMKSYISIKSAFQQLFETAYDLGA